jgi:hypothetical protein
MRHQTPPYVTFKLKNKKIKNKSLFADPREN